MANELALMDLSEDVREQILNDVKKKRVRAVLKSCSTGVLAGMEELRERATQIDLRVVRCFADGSEVREDDVIAVLDGSPLKIAMAEETLVGLVAKPSGVATAARQAVVLADGKLDIVCGAWKKLPVPFRAALRKAASIGGVKVRISDLPFVYLDKNYVRVLGGVADALRAVSRIKDRVKVVQLRGDSISLEKETEEAVDGRADIIFVDTGRIEDIRTVLKALERLNARNKLKVAFGGNVSLSDLPSLVLEGLDIVEIGREIIDAPLLDLRFDVTDVV